MSVQYLHGCRSDSNEPPSSYHRAWPRNPLECTGLKNVDITRTNYPKFDCKYSSSATRSSLIARTSVRKSQYIVDLGRCCSCSKSIILIWQLIETTRTVSPSTNSQALATYSANHRLGVPCSKRWKKQADMEQRAVALELILCQPHTS